VSLRYWDRGVNKTNFKPVPNPGPKTHAQKRTETRTYDRASIRKPPVRQPKSISSFLAGFKSAVNSKIDDYIDQHQLKIPKYNRYNHFFQPNYHDHIIRNSRQYWRIKNYIRNNPKKWYQDIFFKR